MNHATTTPAHSVPKAHTTAASTDHASKRYRTDSAEVVALNNVTVNFEKARFTAIMGPSGSGKSTLLPLSGRAGHALVGSGQRRRDRPGDAVRPDTDAVTGLGLGTAAGVALSRVRVDQGIVTVRSAGLLMVHLVVEVAVGALAAVGPFLRARRTDVLSAVTDE